MEQHTGKSNLSKPKAQDLQIIAVNRIPLIVLIFSYLFLGSCNEVSDKTRYMPQSVGELAELVVVYHKAGSTEAFKDSVRKVFSAPNEGLPPPAEGRFKVLFTDESYFKSYFKEHHNIFVILTEENLELLTNTYGADNQDKVKEIIANKDALGFNKQNVWAENQNVFYVTAENQRDLYQKLGKRSAELRSQANKNEVKTGSLKILTISSDEDSLYQQLWAEKGYALRKPASFRVAINNGDYVWLRKESRKYNFGLMLYSVPYTDQEQLTQEGVIAIRDRFTRKYIPGELEGSYMVVDTRLEPYFSDFNYKNRYAVMLKGWWRVVNDHMGGPFVLHSVYDEKSQRLIFVEGFVYGPNENKVKPLREIEIILNSLDIK
jgi:hypothetical protein